MTDNDGGDKMGEKWNQVMFECLQNVVEVIMQSRVPILGTPSIRPSGAVSSTPTTVRGRNRFGLEIEEIDFVRENFAPWRSDPHCRLRIDVFLNGSRGRLLMERWTVDYVASTKGNAGIGGDSLSYIRNTCKHIAILLRTLHAYTRIMPCHLHTKSSKIDIALSFSYADPESSQFAPGTKLWAFRLCQLKTPYGTLIVQTQYRTAIEHEPNLLTAAESSFPAIDVTGTGRLTMGEAQQQEQDKSSNFEHQTNAPQLEERISTITPSTPLQCTRTIVDAPPPFGYGRSQQGTASIPTTQHLAAATKQPSPQSLQTNVPVVSTAVGGISQIDVAPPPFSFVANNQLEENVIPGPVETEGPPDLAQHPVASFSPPFCTASGAIQVERRMSPGSLHHSQNHSQLHGLLSSSSLSAITGAHQAQQLEGLDESPFRLGHTRLGLGLVPLESSVSSPIHVCLENKLPEYLRPPWVRDLDPVSGHPMAVQIERHEGPEKELLPFALQQAEESPIVHTASRFEGDVQPQELFTLFESKRLECATMSVPSGEPVPSDKALDNELEEYKRFAQQLSPTDSRGMK